MLHRVLNFEFLLEKFDLELTINLMMNSETSINSAQYLRYSRFKMMRMFGLLSFVLIFTTSLFYSKLGPFLAGICSLITAFFISNYGFEINAIHGIAIYTTWLLFLINPSLNIVRFKIL